MTAASLDDVLLELRALRRLLERQLLPAQREVVVQLHAVFGSSGFTTRELVQVCALPIGARPALRAALVALCGELHVQRVGLSLRAIVAAGGSAGAVRLTAPRAEAGRRLWCCDEGTPRD